MTTIVWLANHYFKELNENSEEKPTPSGLYLHQVAYPLPSVGCFQMHTK